jgi:GNAT superfamily N-acetyltransferase
MVPGWDMRIDVGRDSNDGFEIVDWDARYADAFRDLNLAWIEEYFEVEEEDRRQLFSPQEAIIRPGGSIYIGLIDGRPVAACALQKQDEGVYELAKMAVDPGLRGQGLGRRLLSGVIGRAREMGIRKLTIVSNRRLAPALHLYRDAGFREVSLQHREYARVDIELELNLV